MTTDEICLLTRQANAIGKDVGVVCKYEWSRRLTRFQWSYYRRGTFIGSTATREKVIPQMEKYVEAK